MRLEELYNRIGKIITKNPSCRFRPVLYWRGKRAFDNKDTFGTAEEIIVCTIDMASGSSLSGRMSCIVLSPIEDFVNFKKVETPDA